MIDTMWWYSAVKKVLSIYLVYGGNRFGYLVVVRNGSSKYV